MKKKPEKKYECAWRVRFSDDDEVLGLDEQLEKEVKND